MFDGKLDSPQASQTGSRQQGATATEAKSAQPSIPGGSRPTGAREAKKVPANADAASERGDQTILLLRWALIIATGPGIPAQDHPKLFQRFSSLKNAQRDSTGLGLFIVKTITEAHGGSVRFECPREGGTTFEVSLPLPG